MAETLIRCEGLVKIYKAYDLEVFALQGLDLTVQAGELLAIIGNSGSGKSTLLNILGGLDAPTAGRVTVGPWDLLRLSSAQRSRFRREMAGFVWQNNARNLIPYLTAVENVELPMMLSGGLKRRRAAELLGAVGLGGRMHHKLTQLSGGEQQRVAVALALANNPPLLLADEPTGSVDTRTAEQVLEVLRSVNREFGTTVVIVTHDQALARAVDRYVLVRDGKTSTEAVRRIEVTDTAEGRQEQEVHEELAVIDSAGRLQIPKEHIEQLGLSDRARIEVRDGAIIIKHPASV